MEFNKYLKDRSALIDRELFRLSDGKSQIDKAMRYSLTAGGKRLRPVLVLCASDMCGLDEKFVLPAACALEYIHTYSLIHDDLPAMDNDDLRRGKPTSHIKYGEATAILAGDALLTEAFGLMLKCASSGKIKHKDILDAIGILVEASGKNGMIAGQAQDTMESGKWRRISKYSAAKILRNIHLNKTAALLRASLTIGAVLAGANKKSINLLDKYGECIGLAFQITDDILDIEGDKRLLGKKGSDQKNNKLTYPAVYGLKRSKEMSKKLVAKAKAQLIPFGSKGKILSELAEYICKRTY